MKTRHLLRILEVIGLVFLVSLVGHFFGWAAGTCKPLPEEWKEEAYGFRWAPPLRATRALSAATRLRPADG